MKERTQTTGYTFENFAKGLLRQKWPKIADFESEFERAENGEITGRKYFSILRPS